MKTITTYSITHNLGRAATSTADADAIVDAVSSGDSLFRDRVQAELNEHADSETQKLYEIEICTTENEVEVDD